MATLSGNKVKDTYTSLLKLASNGVTSSLKVVEDGAGTDSALKLSTDTVEVDGTLSFTTAPTTDSAELTALLVDGSNNVVKRELDSSAFSGGAVNSFNTISVSGQTDVVADSSTDTLTFVGGDGIDVTTNAATDTITIANSSFGFKTISVSGQTDVVADSNDDTLTLVGGTGIDISTTASSDTVTITSSGLATPMIAVRPSGAYTLTTTLAIPDPAAVENTIDNGSVEISGGTNVLDFHSTKLVNVVTAGPIKIDLNLVLEVTAQADVQIDVIRERPEGATPALLQSITRGDEPAGNRVISYSLFSAARAGDVYYYKIKKDSSGAGSLLQTSTFVVTKLS